MAQRAKPMHKKQTVDDEKENRLVKQKQISDHPFNRVTPTTAKCFIDVSSSLFVCTEFFPQCFGLAIFERPIVLACL